MPFRAPTAIVASDDGAPRKSKLFSICEVRPYLLIAGYGALTEAKLHECGVTHAVDATNIPKTARFHGVDYMEVNVDDSELGDLRPHFRTVADFVKTARDAGGKALIYCAAGISRSASLCFTTLMILEERTLQEAYAEVLAVRPMIAPNLGFWRQLIEFEQELSGSGKPTVQLLKGMRRSVPSVYLYRTAILDGAKREDRAEADS